MDSSSSRDSRQYQPKMIEPDNFDEVFSRGSRKPSRSIGKISAHPSSFRPNQVSVSESINLSQDPSERKIKTSISPVKKSHHSRLKPGSIMPRYSVSPVDQSHASKGENIINNISPPQGLSSVEQSFVAEAVELVKAVSRNSISHSERSRTRSLAVNKENKQMQQEEEEDKEREDNGEEESEDEGRQQPIQPSRKNTSQISRSMTKNGSQIERLGRSKTSNRHTLSRIEPEPVDQSVRTVRKDTSQIGKEQLSRISVHKNTSSQIERGDVVESVRPTVSQMVERSLVSQKSARFLKNASLASKQSQIYNNSKVDLEVQMKSDVQGQSYIREESIRGSNLTERQRMSSLMLKEGRDISVVEEEAKSGFDRLAAMKGLSFKQKFEVIEGLSSWEVQHRTYVHDFSLETSKPEQIFQCNENSSFCAKQCLSNYCRPFNVTINVCGEKEDHEDAPPFLLIESRCSCACFWFNRPEVQVRWVENGKHMYMGKIKDSFNCGDICMDIYDHNDTLLYVIEGNCCQCGLMCNCYCESCQTVDFFIKPTGDGRVIKMQKKNASLSGERFPNADRFQMMFSENTPPQEKALLLSAILFMESRHFEGDV